MKPSLTNSAYLQLAVSNINRVQGLAITALVYRLYDLATIGHYFFVLSIYGVLISAQQFGSSRTVVKYHIENDSTGTTRILKTRLLLSIAAMTIFMIATFSDKNPLSLAEMLLLALCLPMSALIFDFALMSAHRFKALGIIHAVAQLSLLIILTLAYVNSIFGSTLTGTFIGSEEGAPTIVLHQLIPTIVLFFAIGIYVQRTDPGRLDPLNTLKALAHSQAVNLQYFVDNRLLIFTALFLAAVSFVDYLVGYIYLDAEGLGIWAGLLRLASFAYGLMVALNTVFFAYGQKEKGSTSKTKKRILRTVNLATIVFLLVIAYPYLRWVMNLNDPMSFGPAVVLIIMGVAVMPVFFLALSTIEENNQQVNFWRLIRYITTSLIIYCICLILLMTTPMILTDPQTNLTWACLMFLVKWLLISISLWMFNAKSRVI
ncbi:MAG: hypothetical protein ABGY96_11115 [bacterium]|nr:hypothetical protein [Gammaproteobacteria bacterium]HIL96679.1 hypothetical protein [Pseudomonadales bacterium]